MVLACNKEFSRFGISSFMVCDARALPFKGEFVDLALFSFNGLDSVTHEDRLVILGEIKRLVKKNGTFVFSSHNLNWFETLFTLRGIDLMSSYEFFARLVIKLSYKHEVESLMLSSHAIINATPPQYYVKLDEQVRQLLGAGFKDVCVVTPSGILGGDDPSLRRVADKEGFLYYICRV